LTSGASEREISQAFFRLPLPPEYWIPLLSRKQQQLLFASIVPWVLCLTLFILWWANRAHHLSVFGTIFTTLMCFYEVLLCGYFYYFLRRLKTVNFSLEPDPAWRHAMVVTKAPAEPWEVAKQTLLACLAQDIRHDTWLADEDPTEETLEWCLAHEVKVSTRRGVSEYHRPSWPRRTKCKEGNLAYFYDKYGYEHYDYVAQLDVDHCPEPTYLRSIVIPFHDRKVGYVAAPSICDKNAAESWSARGRLYKEAALHGPMQAGFNDKWAPLCIGSHYAVRTEALREIGGLGPELAEDHSTTMIMNAAGWRGVFQIDAIAHGDGPACFNDCMTQEFQWSRSLTMILLEHTPQHIRTLRNRQKFQFLFAQTWYPLISSILILGIVSVLLCLAFDTPLMHVNYLEYIAIMTAMAIANYLPIVALKHFRLLRPKSSRLISWEEPLFAISRLPWMFSGVLSGAYSVLTKQKLTFLVTPKQNSSNLPLPKRSILPYFAMAVICGLVLIIAGDRHRVEGYYLLALMSGITFATALALIVCLHALESGYARKRQFFGRVTMPLAAFALLGLGGMAATGHRDEGHRQH
jgi:cellulose synthase (UDP-forming)